MLIQCITFESNSTHVCCRGSSLPAIKIKGKGIVHHIIVREGGKLIFWKFLRTPILGPFKQNRGEYSVGTLTLSPRARVVYERSRDVSEWRKVLEWRNVLCGRMTTLADACAPELDPVTTLLKAKRVILQIKHQFIDAYRLAGLPGIVQLVS